MASEYKKGFTILEMIVVVTIVSLIAGVVLFNYRSFTQRLALSAASQEIAVAVRQAQVYGRSVKNVTQGSGDFGVAFGVDFNIGPNSNSYYILFADKDGNGVYNGTSACLPTSECVEKNLIRNGAIIAQICGAIGTGVPNCSVSGARSIAITFLRPDREAYIYFSDGLGNRLGNTAYTSGQIKLGDSSGNMQASVVVNSIGQILTQ